jgi:tetratricopeptide (TPR) repeat protein
MYEAAASPRFREPRAVTASIGLNMAARSYRRALELDNANAEVRARLGFVLMRLDRRDEARAELELALAGHEAAPRCQIAALALSNALVLLGNRDAAIAIARGSAMVGPDQCDDPWWSYDYGQAWRLEATLAALRRDAVR